LQALQAVVAWQRLDCGQVLFRQGEPGDTMYIVIQGRLRLTVTDPDGRERILGELGAGECVGEFALLAEGGAAESRRSATVAATRLTDVIALARPHFEAVLARHPHALLNLTRRIIRRQGRLSQGLVLEVGALVVAVVPLQPGLAVVEFAQHLAQALAPLGATLHMDAESFEQRYGKPGAAQTPLDQPASLVIDAWLDERECEQRYVIYSAVPTLDEGGRLTHWARRCLEDADIILLVGAADADPAPAAFDLALPAAHTQARLELVLLHPADCLLPQGTPAWLAARPALQAHHHVRQGRPADLRRLARRLSGRPVGLVFSGGGARGLAHIGVLQALAEANLEVDWVAGASMGALIAGACALDWSHERLVALAAQFSDRRKLLDYTFPYTAITATRRITRLLQELSAGADIADTWRPFFCISANLSRGAEQVHLSGPLWQALRASMAFPAVFAPLLAAGDVLIDGGAANNLPVDHMRRLCPTGLVIGVDMVTKPPLQQPYHFGPSLSGWQALLARFTLLGRPLRAPSLLEIVAGVVDSNSRFRLDVVRPCADLMLAIPVADFGLLDFDQHAAIIKLGYAAAREQLSAWQKAPARLC
jgi:predicted acylesterase/phospholipase RssA/CRP-like cAMP-binding protein